MFSWSVCEEALWWGLHFLMPAKVRNGAVKHLVALFSPKHQTTHLVIATSELRNPWALWRFLDISSGRTCWVVGDGREETQLKCNIWTGKIPERLPAAGRTQINSQALCDMREWIQSLSVLKADQDEVCRKLPHTEWQDGSALAL